MENKKLKGYLHLSGLAIIFMGFSGWLLPLCIYLTNNNNEGFDKEWRKLLNFHLSFTLYIFITVIGLVIFPVLFLLPMMLIALYYFIMGSYYSITNHINIAEEDLPTRYGRFVLKFFK